MQVYLYQKFETSTKITNLWLFWEWHYSPMEYGHQTLPKVTIFRFTVRLYMIFEPYEIFWTIELQMIVFFWMGSLRRMVNGLIQLVLNSILPIGELPIQSREIMFLLLRWSKCIQKGKKYGPYNMGRIKYYMAETVRFRLFWVKYI